MSPRARTWLSFTVLIAAALVLTAAWKQISFEPADAEIAPAFRKVMELNGAIWKKLYRPDARNTCQPPPAGRAARVNGDIGLQPNVHAESWRLSVDQDEGDPNARKLSLSLQELQSLPRTETAVEFRCIEGWSEDMSFAGVRFSDFMKAYNLKAKPYVGLVSVDGQYYVSLDIESMMHDQTLLAYEQNGQPLSADHGFPLRLMVPNKYGIKNLKQIGKIFFSDRRPPDYWAEEGYDWHADL